MSARIVLIDNQDSFVYNLVDAFVVGGYDCTVYRNTVPVAEILATEPDLIVLSPGPGHPRGAGVMMELIAAALDRGIPLLGICLGFQGLLEHFGGVVRPCGPVHGITDVMRCTPVVNEIFDTPQVLIARYHSLGCTDVPAGLEPLAFSDSTIGPVVMAAQTPDRRAIGLQFHPESVLSPTGPIILDRCIAALLPTTHSTGEFHD